MIKKTTILILGMLVLILVISIVFIKTYISSTQNNQENSHYLVQVKTSCNLEKNLNILFTIELQKSILLAVTMDNQQKQKLEQDSCIINIWTDKEAKNKFTSLPKALQDIIKKELKNHKLDRTIIRKDLPDKDDLLKRLRKEDPTLPPNIVSHYQLYITPNDPAVKNLAKRTKNTEQAYKESVSWVWVSEEILNKTEEKWLKPHEFLTNTPNYATNPVPGKIASDCSEQANTLVSILRAQGMPANKIRVVLGKVDFSGKIGGHAWVQVDYNGKWVDLDPTSGSFWDEKQNKLVQSSGLAIKYFYFFPFPVIENWAYYNDVYFYDAEIKKGNAPKNWTRS
ncbi:hypothetical protein CL633_01220 [bacterium]|nr:hypothetical protein [bacterium]|tara:strand:+ start:369 stop:1385 length:1017 start_codon:yes stop_codon:yes gene_type:complete